MSSDFECPYCSADLNVNHDDGFGYEEDRAHEMQCSECDKNFVFFTSISYNYSAHKADCLNGSEHKIRRREYSSFVTEDCEDCSYTNHHWKGRAK